jgi:signal transduction histidine kinase
MLAVSRLRGWVAASSRPIAFVTTGAVVAVLTLFGGLQWYLFRPIEDPQLGEAWLKLVLGVAVVAGVFLFDFMRESPAIHRPLVGAFTLGGVSATTSLLGVFLHQPVGFGLVFEQGAFLAAVGSATVAVSRFADAQETKQAELRRHNERLETFASVASHDLRNPLQVAHGSLEVARQTGDEEALDRVERALNRMDDIVDDVLEFSRVGPEYVEAEPVQFGTVAQAAWEGIDAAEARMSVENDGTINADPQMLQQALENLFRNSIDHVGEDVAVWVGVTRNGFYVMDDGPGIDSADREKVFETGYSKGDSGTGFGLAIVQRIIEAHGWSIRAVTGHQRGARFEVRTE